MNPAASTAARKLRSGRTALQLACLKDADGPNLLLLHELFGNKGDWSDAVLTWEGSVWALDFSGHGDSAWREGGIYFPEILVTDADAALAELGEAFVAGAGVGAYAALLLAGGRPQAVHAALLLPGEGLSGFGPEPQVAPDREAFARLTEAHRGSVDPASQPHDPRVLLAGADTRPPDYALTFAERANALVLSEDGSARPPWWEGLREATGVTRSASDLGAALRELRSLA